MAVINVYTRKAGEKATEPVPVPANLSALPGSAFLPKPPRKGTGHKKRIGGNAESVSYSVKVKKCVPGSVWGNGSETVTVDYVSGFGEFLFVSFTDEHGNPTGYTAIGSFLSRFPIPCQVERDERKRAEPVAIDADTGERKRNATDLGSFV